MKKKIQSPGSPALTAGEAISLPALLTIPEVGAVLGYKDDRGVRRWLKANAITAHKGGSRCWPRASIVRALGTLAPSAEGAK